MKKLLVGLAAALVVVLGLAGGTVLAQSADEDGEKKSFAERVAEILGLESDTVEDALKQARSEMQEERTDAWLDKAVEAEKMTQDEADSLNEWYDEKPDGVWAGFGGRGKFGYGRGHGKFRGKGGFHGRSGGGWHMFKGNKSTDATPAVEGSSA